MGDHVSRPLSKLFAEKTAATLYCHLVLDKLYNCFIVKTCYLNYNLYFSILETMSEIVYAAGEGPSVQRKPSNLDSPVQDKKPIKMSRAKTWSQDVEEIWRFQEAGYRDQSEYEAFNPNQEVGDSYYMIHMMRGNDSSFR